MSHKQVSDKEQGRTQTHAPGVHAYTELWPWTARQRRQFAGSRKARKALRRGRGAGKPGAMVRLVKGKWTL